jgi:5'-nucleotidase
MLRRDFIQNSLVSGAGLLISPNLIANPNFKKTKKITILHTNDTHSNIEAFSKNHSTHPSMGGVSRRFELIQQIRNQEENVLLFDAGDIFQGTPYFNRYGGVLELKLMSKLMYDAGTMGNHDFDGGMDGFFNAKKHANFPFICSNYDFKNTILEGQTITRKIFDKGGLKVGVFGLGVELSGLVPDVLYKETRYLDPIEIASDSVRDLKNEGCDIVVCLSHLGYEYASNKISDRILAQKTKGIDLIIGGHTHTFLEKPTVELNSEGKSTLINQVGWAGLRLGRVDFYIGKNKKSSSDYIVID